MGPRQQQIANYAGKSVKMPLSNRIAGKVKIMAADYFELLGVDGDAKGDESSLRQAIDSGTAAGGEHLQVDDAPREQAEKGVTASEPADPKKVGQLLLEHMATGGPPYQADKTAGKPKAEAEKEAALTKQTAEADGQPADDKQAATKKPQSREERAQHAARRREREQRQLAEQIREQERQHLAEEQDTFIASLKLTDPYTMAPIRTKADYERYLAAVQDEQARLDYGTAEGQARLDSGIAEGQARLDYGTAEEQTGMSSGTAEGQASQEELAADISALQQAQQAIAVARESLAKAEFTQQQAQGAARLEHELAAVAKLDPAITSLDALRDQEYTPAIIERLRRGYDLVDAYRLATEELRGAKDTARRQQALMNRASGKKHLRPNTPQQGTALVNPPAEIKKYYRMMCPELSDKEIAKHYTRELNERGE